MGRWREGGADPPLSVQRANSDASSNRNGAGSMPSLPFQVTVLISTPISGDRPNLDTSCANGKKVTKKTSLPIFV